MLLTSLIPRVQLQSNSIPDNAALIHLQETARRFFRETSVWITDLTFDSVADQAAYALDLSSEVDAGTTPKVSRILYLTYNGAKVYAQGYYLRPVDDYLVFNTNYIPGEAVTDGIVAKVAIHPAIDGTDFPLEYIEKYVDGIVGGALVRLLRTPSRPYTNPGAAVHFENDYKRDFIRARMDLASEGTERGDNYNKSTENSGNLSG